MDERAVSELRRLITSEINFGFTFTDTARLSRDSGDKDHHEHELRDARAACQAAERHLAQLPPDQAAEFQQRLDALRSIVFDSPNTSRTASGHG